MINKAIILGNTGKDPEIRMAGAAKVASFSLATTETYKNKAGEKITDTEWHNCEAWGALADVIEKYVKKGDKLYIEGKIIYQTYEKDGLKHNVTKIRVSQMVMIGSKPETKVIQPDPKVIPTGDEFPDSFEDTDDLPF